MATPIYNAAWRHHGGGFHGHRRGFLAACGALLGDNTPQYLGAGQPTAAGGCSLLGDGTPVYRTAMGVVLVPTMAPSTTTAPPPLPQGQGVIGAPRP